MTANKNNDDFSNVNLRRERLQADLDKGYTKTFNEEIEKAMDALRNLQNAVNGKEEHVNVLFEKQKESAKETGKPSSPENVKKVINEFYKNGEKLIYRGDFWSNMGVSFWNHGPTQFDKPIKGISVIIKQAEQIIKEGMGLSKDQVIEHKVKGTKTIYGNIYVDEFPDEPEQPFDVTLTTWCPICNKFYHAKLYGICRTSATDYVARAWVPWKEGRP